MSEPTIYTYGNDVEKKQVDDSGHDVNRYTTPNVKNKQTIKLIPYNFQHIRMKWKPPNIPEFKVLYLGFFKSIQDIQH